MDLAFLATLKERLINADDFSKVWEYFLDNFGEDPEFMDLGKRTRHTVVESLIVEMAKKLCKLTVAPRDILLTELATHQFIHGGYCANGNMINVIYFEEIFMGSIMICTIGSEQTTVMRFTGRKVPPRAEPSLN